MLCSPTRSARLTTTTILFLFSVLAFGTLEAQGRRDRDRLHMGRGVFQAGMMVLDLDELNATLTDAGYPMLEERFLTLGGSGYGSRGRVVVGGEFQGLLGSEETTADASRQINLNGGYGLFRLGYLAVAEGGFELVPAVGLGGGGMMLQIIERSSPTFDDVLANPSRSSTLSTGMFLVDGSLAMNYRVVLRSDGPRVGGLLVGLQGGYTYAPLDTSWDLDGINNVAGGPDLHIEGFYARVSIGGWSRRGRR